MTADVVVEPGIVATNVIDSAREGDEGALTEVVRTYQPFLVRYLRGLGTGDVDDVAQQVWIDVASSLHRFSGDGVHLRRWICTIARRRMIDAHRSRVRHQEQPVAAPPDAGGVDPDDPAALDWALGLIRRLPAAQAEVVLLRVLLDLPVSEVAHVTGQSPGAVRVMTHRALAQLRTLLEGPVESGEPVDGVGRSVLFGSLT
ncbi:MAG: sigma-70 family RNA polymerase sigma factor [Acidimicrobiales bacterium]|nr:sigma-70 family RNA polymerase sigma factor [Acidimicrobiales bacterium]